MTIKSVLNDMSSDLQSYLHLLAEVFSMRGMSSTTQKNGIPTRTTRPRRSMPSTGRARTDFAR